MPKTKNAFALHGFDKGRIWKQKFFKPIKLPRKKSKARKEIFESYLLFFGLSTTDTNEEMDNSLKQKLIANEAVYDRKGEFSAKETLMSICDSEILTVYWEEAVKAQNKNNLVRVKWIADILNTISKNLSGYLDKIYRHYQRLETFSKKWNEIICENETFSADDIRTKTRRIQELLKSYEEIQETIAKLLHIANYYVEEINTVYEKADRNIFAIRLREARKAKGLTQAQVANQLGMTQGGYTGYENSTREPSIATLKKIARILKRPTDWLLGLEPYETRRLINLDDFK